MIDLKQIVGFDWDDGNGRKNSEGHNVSQAEAEQAFFNQPLLLLADIRHSDREQRFHALGHTDDARLMHITFTLRRDRTLIRVISARDISRKERFQYEQGH